MPDSQRGISLIELIVFIVIVGVALAGIATSINYNVQHSVDPIVRKQALAAAESMLEEVMLQNFADPDGTDAGETGRTDWDDLDDYHNYTRSGISSLDDPTHTISGMEDYTIKVEVESGATVVLKGVPSDDLSGGGIPTGEVKLIRVTVDGPINTSVILEGYRTNYAG